MSSEIFSKSLIKFLFLYGLMPALMSALRKLKLFNFMF